jgi:hypothetical protein
MPLTAEINSWEIPLRAGKIHGNASWNWNKYKEITFRAGTSVWKCLSGK